MTPAQRPELESRVAALEDFYRQVQRERMQGIPLLNPALRVEAIGFQWAAGDDDAASAPPIAEGVLVTPWFMSLVRLPAVAQAHQDRVGRSQVRDFGCEQFDFIGSHDPAIGYHETCALFSPMNDFDTQALACDTARATLAALRPQAPARPARAAAEPMPARRAFFLARGSSPR
jgi:[NiFe] hydrogenase assembly HybE family chaperone